MTAIDIFNEVFDGNVFIRPKTQERTDKRTCAYTFMKRKMGMSISEIASETRKDHATISAGIKRFEGLLETNDKIAVELWEYVNKRVNAILAYTDGEILTIDMQVDKECAGR